MTLPNASSYTSIALGEAVFPFDAREGTVLFDPEASIGLDVAKPHGKDVPKITVNGKEASRVKLTLTWSFRIEAMAKEFLLTVSPVGPNSGIPLDVNHPDAEIFAIDAMIVQKIHGLKREPGKASIQLEGVGWKKDVPAQVGGAVVPDKAQQWVDSPTSTTLIGSNNNTIGGFGSAPAEIGSNNNKVGGFNGPNAPTVTP